MMAQLVEGVNPIGSQIPPPLCGGDGVGLMSEGRLPSVFDRIEVSEAVVSAAAGLGQITVLAELDQGRGQDAAPLLFSYCLDLSRTKKD